MSRKFYCPAPWYGGHFTFDQQSICCSYEPLQGNSPLSYLRIDEIQQLKQDISNDIIPPGCKKCHRDEGNGFESTRQRYLAEAHRYGLDLPTDPLLPTQPQVVEVRFGNLCNFKCRMCSPKWSNLIGEEIKTYPSLKKLFGDQYLDRYAADPVFFSEMVSMLPNLKRLYITGGEPTLDKNAIKYLERAVTDGWAQNINLFFATNCSTLNPNFITIITKFKSVNIILSIDAIGKVAEYQRHGTDWPVVEKNLRTYMELSRDTDTVRPSFHSVVTAYSVLDVGNLLKFYVDLSEQGQRLINFGLSLTVSTQIEFSPLSLAGDARQKAIQSVTEGISYLEPDCISHHQFIPRCIETLKSLKFKLENETVDPDHYNRFLSYTQALDLSRNENFSDTFNIQP